MRSNSNDMIVHPLYAYEGFESYKLERKQVFQDIYFLIKFLQIKNLLYFL